MIKTVKDTADGDRKYARMMSNIYKGTMWVPPSLVKPFRQLMPPQRNYLANGRPTPRPANSMMIDLGGMAV